MGVSTHIMSLSKVQAVGVGIHTHIMTLSKVKAVGVGTHIMSDPQ